MNNYFVYNTGNSILTKDIFRISPSQVSRFFDDTPWWWREQVLKETPKFLQSTASELGNCVHAAAAMYFDTGSVDHDAILFYINSITNYDVDINVILEQYPAMVDVLIDQFLSKTKATHSEWFINTPIASNVYAAGSCDLVDTKRRILYDYKTMGSLDKARIPTSFPRAYWFQQMTYAYILTKNNYPIDYIKLVYVTRSNVGRVNEKGKPLKDYPSEVHVITEPVTQQSLDIIESTLKLISESYSLWQSNPEYRHLLAQDMRLKIPAKPILFKD